MDAGNRLKCPECGESNFAAKYQATYVYTYMIDSNAPGTRNDVEFLPFLFDRREQTDSQQYMECSSCGARYPCFFGKDLNGADSISLQAAITSASVQST